MLVTIGHGNRFHFTDPRLTELQMIGSKLPKALVPHLEALASQFSSMPRHIGHGRLKHGVVESSEKSRSLFVF